MTSKLLSFKKWHFPNETVLTQAAQAELRTYFSILFNKTTKTHIKRTNLGAF